MFLSMKVPAAAVLISFLQVNVIALSCAFLADAPVVEEFVPNFQHTVKFLNVDATVYRHALGEGSQPRIRILRYSSPPVISIDSTTNEVLVSTESSNCLDSSAPVKKGSFPGASVASATVATLMLLAPNTAARSVGAALLGLFNTGVEAAGTSCTAAMEIVIEAPPYYLGSVAECRAQVENPDHCPEDFPTFPTCSDPNPSCKLAVVGAGTGGLYTAMRLIDENKFDGSDVCVFESTERVGGRLYSLRGFGPDNKITVDAGGYRTWPEYTPTTHALIEDMLGLKTGCYEDESKLDGPCEKFNIVDDDGVKIGFATMVEEMMRLLIDEGVCFFPRHELTSIQYHSDETNTLTFANGVIAPNVPEVVLNIPQRALLTILRKSDIPFDGGANEEKELYDAAHAVQSEVVTKLYLYYDDAWWYKLGLFNGDYELPGDARNMLLQGRYHDGHVECTGTKCHGFLLAVYAHDFGGNKAQFFRRYQRDRPEPVTIISNTDIEGAAFLQHAHNRLQQFHLYEAVNASYTGFEAQQAFAAAGEPAFAVLATWNPATYGAGGGWHHWTDLDMVDKASKPLNAYHIHVINEAFSKLQGWAEGSLLLADEVLKDYFEVERPWAFDAPDFVQRLAQTSSQECFVEEDTSGGGGGGGGGSTGGGGGDTGGGGGDDVLCFTGDALVQMADGTLVQLSDVKLGDYVFTGFPGQTGLVTEVLVHKVLAEEVVVAVVSTPFGDLVGTPSHPIYLNGQWMELEQALDDYQDGDQTAGFESIEAYLETRPVDVFYNLEIDGDSPGSSSHSYVVNGVIASGLGDNLALNTQFARQKFWKAEA